MSFVDLDTVKDLLGIPDVTTKEDAAIQVNIDAANAEVLACLCLDQCDLKTYNLVADIPFDRPIRCVASCPIPVSSVVEVRDSGTVLTKGKDWVFDGPDLVCLCESLCRLNKFTPGCEKVEIDVIAGFAPGDVRLPALKLGVAHLAMSMYRSGAGDFVRETIGRYSYERRVPKDMPMNASAGWPDSLTRAMGEFWRPERSVMAHVRP